MVNPRFSRQVRYNRELIAEEQPPFGNQWYFMILNEPIEIDKIESRILKELAPCGELTKLESGILVPGKRLACNFLNLQSKVSRIPNTNKIYNSPKFYRDPSLNEFSEEKFLRYLQKFLP